eukprot:3616264-Rhodomonas_salina.1
MCSVCRYVLSHTLSHPHALRHLPLQLTTLRPLPGPSRLQPGPPNSSPPMPAQPATPGSAPPHDSD